MQTTTIARIEALAALNDGAKAKREGLRVTACPFSASGDADERVLTAAWIRGYVLTR